MSNQEKQEVLYRVIRQCEQDGRSPEETADVVDSLMEEIVREESLKMPLARSPYPH